MIGVMNIQIILNVVDREIAVLCTTMYHSGNNYRVVKKLL